MLSDKRSIFPQGMIPIYCEDVRAGTAYFDAHSDYRHVFVETKENDFITTEPTCSLRPHKWYLYDLRNPTRKPDYILPTLSELSSLEINNASIKDFNTDDLLRHLYREFPEYQSKPGASPDSPDLYASYDAVQVFCVGNGSAALIQAKTYTKEGSFPDIWFDYGCDFLYAQSVIASIANDLNNASPLPDKIIIISHWDLDHSICLGHLSGDNRTKVLSAGEMPRTARREAIHSHLVSKGIQTNSIGFSALEEKSLFPRAHFNNVTIWSPPRSSNANKQSLVLQCSNKSSALLCGDQHYKIICKSIREPQNKQHVIMSHHGGCAGGMPERIDKHCTGQCIASSDGKSMRYKNGSIKWPVFQKAIILGNRSSPPHVLDLLKP